MDHFLSNILSKIKTSPTLAVTNKAAKLRSEGKDVISLSTGEPDFGTPDNIKEAGIKAIKDNLTKYTPVDGVPKLKEAICDKFLRDNELQYTTEQITVGSGAKHVIFNSLIATLNPGDEVIIPAPYWVSYPDMVAFAGGTPVILDSSYSDNFKIKPEALESKITEKTKWLILNFPNNPTGVIHSKNEMHSILEVLKKYPKIHILSDDIYEHIIYDDLEFYTAAQVMPELSDRILTVNGVSKAYAMTGWRIGYAGGPAHLIKAIRKIQSQSTSNPCSIAQFAAVEALCGTQSFIKSNNDIFKSRKDLVISELNSTPGMKCHNPNGAFYAFPSCEGVIRKATPKGKIINNDIDFAEYLLEEALVAVVPGSAFGAKNFVRVSYATSSENLKKACDRIKRALSFLS